jgi:polyphosphate kinase
MIQPTPVPAGDQPDLRAPEYFFNRELSLLAFQRRVLFEVLDERNPLLERAKFLSILGSNLDEFFMVRVAGLKQLVASGVTEPGFDGRTPSEQLSAIRTEVLSLSESGYAVWRESLQPALRAEGIEVAAYDSLRKSERLALERYFLRTVFPVLTPLGYDPGRPFPLISNLSLNLAVTVRSSSGQTHFARVKVPDTLPQLVPLKPEPNGAGESRRKFVWLEELITANLQALFPGLEILQAHPFRLTRDAEVEIQELESDDLLETIEEAVWKRRFRSVVRLQISPDMPDDLLAILVENLEVSPDDIYRVDGPLGLKRLMQLQSIDRPGLKFRPFTPATPAALRNRDDGLFALIRKRDLLLHHPYESFQPVVDFLKSAARDPDVLAIKMTLYRVGRNSPIVEALLNAVEEGKQVSVLVELKARFDEESNIEWARALESQGVHVVYGLVGLKVHSKIALVVRREGEDMRKYVHLGTGNYNPVTARLYTDFSLFTCDEAIGQDAVTLFNLLTGYSEASCFRKLLVAPLELRPKLTALLDREIGHARAGRPARFVAKMNALDDPQMIQKLYEASQAGVEIDLVVRGICCLRPGVSGVSDRIRVSSVVGRFLEHSRIYWFQNDGDSEVYLGSADMMPRNLSRRIEVVFPVESARLARRLKEEILDVYVADNVNAWALDPDGRYHLKPSVEPLVDAQTCFLS